MKNRVVKSFTHAISGLLHAFRTEPNMRIYLFITLLVGMLAIVARVDKLQVILLVITIAMVFVAELFNGAIERVVDLITQQYHPLAKTAKNVAAGAVLVTVINALAVGYFVFFDRFSDLPVFTVTALDHLPPYITMGVLGLVVAIVILIKSVDGKGTYLRGGFPSGHTAVAFSLFTAITMISRDAVLATFGFLLALLVAQSRVASKTHTLIEAIAGALVGILVTVLIFQIINLTMV